MHFLLITFHRFITFLDSVSSAQNCRCECLKNTIGDDVAARQIREVALKKYVIFIGKSPK